MKTAILILIFALGYMFYRGDLGIQPEELGLPPTFQAVQKPTAPKVVDLKQAIQENGESKNATDLIVKDEKTKPNSKPVGIDIFTKEKSSLVAQTLWLESHKVQDEDRTMLDKFHNLVSWGKWE